MQVTHTICLNGGNLSREENAFHNPLVTGTNHSTLDVAALKNDIVLRGNEYKRKLELANEIKKMYKCHDYTFSTNWSSNLRKHVKFTHNPNVILPMYECQECPYSTNWISNLRRHAMFKHNPWETKQVYESQDCPYFMNWISNLRKHEKAMHNPNDLRKHEKAIHNPWVTEYHCTNNVTAVKNEIMHGENEY